MMKKILILGDSTIQWLRPYRNHNDQYTYSELILNQYFVEIVSKPGATSKDILNIYWNELAGKFYDICIISVGINDLTPRTYPRWLWKLNNDIIVSNNYFEKFFQFIYKVLTYSKFQTLCSKFEISKPWVYKNNFKKNLKKLQEIVLKESDSKIIFLSLPMVSDRVKNILPSIEKSIIIEYKEVFETLENERTTILDIERLFKENTEKYNPEGIHYSADGHKKVFEELIKIIEKESV